MLIVDFFTDFIKYLINYPLSMSLIMILLGTFVWNFVIVPYKKGVEFEDLLKRVNQRSKKVRNKNKNKSWLFDTNNNSLGIYSPLFFYYGGYCNDNV
jgi:hypothetical protein